MSKRRSRKRYSERDENKEGFESYPEEFPIAISHSLFPGSEWVFNRLDYPLGLCMRPFICHNTLRTTSYSNVSKSIKDISRCSECGAYLNRHCEYNPVRWFCALCGRRNSHQKHQRYKHIESTLLPELNEAMIDFDAPFSESIPVNRLPIEERPMIHLFLINEEMEMDTLESVIESLSQSFRVFHGDLFFGIVTFSSSRIGLYSFFPDSLIPTVQFIALSSFENSHSERDPNSPNVSEEEFNIGDVVDFADFIEPFHHGSISIPSLLGSIIDLLPDQKDDNQDILENKEQGSLYNAINAVLNWILQSRFVFVPSTISKSSEPPASFPNMGTFLSLFLTGGNPEILSQSIETSYTGVVLHAFYDKFETAMITSKPSEITQALLSVLQQKAMDLSVGINLWSVCSYDSQESFGHLWKPLVQSTGGSFNRFSLRINPDDEKWRLKEELRRCFAKPLATKCLIKVRATPILKVVPGSVAGLVNTFEHETDVFQANMMDADSSISLKFLVDDSCQSGGWNSLDQKVSRPSIKDESQKGTDAVMIQIVMSYETIESIPQQSTHQKNSDGNENEGDTGENDPFLFLQEGLSIWGHEWRDGIESLLRNVDNNSYLSDNDLSEEDIDKILRLRKLLGVKDASQNNGPSKTSSTLKMKNYKRPHLRRDSSLPEKDALYVHKYVRVINLCVDCSENISKIRDSCNLSVALSILLREALHGVGGPPKLDSLQDVNVSTDSSNSSDILIQRISRNIGGEKDLFNSIIHVLKRAATLKELELRKLYQKRHGGGHYTVDVASLHQFLMVDESYSRDVIQALYRGMARILGQVDADSVSLTSGEWNAPRVRDEMINWMFLILRSSPPIIVQLLIPNLWEISVPSADNARDKEVKSFKTLDNTAIGGAEDVDSNDNNVPTSNETTDATSVDVTKSSLSRGLTVQFDNTGLLPSLQDRYLANKDHIIDGNDDSNKTVASADARNESNIHQQSIISAEEEQSTSSTRKKAIDHFLIGADPIPLRRDAMISSGSEYFLLDSGTELILYKPLKFHMHSASRVDKKKDDFSERNVFPLLSHRLLEHPILPRLVISDAGEQSVQVFSSHMLEDNSSETSFSFEECKKLTLEVLETISFDGN